MRFYSEIKKRYGTKKRTLLKEYARTVKKTAHTETTRNFLLECRKRSLIPNFIINSTKNIFRLLDSKSKCLTKLNKIIIHLHKKILNLLIHAICQTSRHTQNLLYTLQEEIIHTLPYDTSHQFLSKQKEFYTKKHAQITLTHSKKIDTMYNKQIQSLNLCTINKKFINLTDVNVPQDIQWLLGLGKKFAIANYGKFPLFDVIADTEEIVKTIKNFQHRDIVRARFANIITNARKKYKQNTTNTQNIIKHIYDKCIKFCKQNKNIVVVQSDKTKCTVLMYATEYDRKVKELLSDENTYQIISQGDPTSKLQLLNNNNIIGLFKNSFIDMSLKYSLTNYNTTAPKLYALPKTHKENIPMRPVVASINTPSSRISKYLSNILKNLIAEDEFNISDSYIFKDRISALTLDHDDRMVSFDVVSLFTNIPVHLTMDIISDRWDELSRHTNIPRQTFFKLLKFCLVDANYFVYKSVFYKQIYGMPMGNPLSSVIADITTQRLLISTFNNLTSKPRILVKYVDDIFAILPGNMIDPTLIALNSFHGKLKFTVEKEHNNRLAYLDVLVIRDENGKLNTDWYRKSNSSDRLLNYYSNHPKNQKINTAYNFTNRVLKLSSSCYHNKNIHTINQTLLNNNYPYSIIKKTIYRCVQKLTQTLDNTSDMQERRAGNLIYRSLTYIEGLSEQVTKILKTYTNNTQIAHKTNACLHNVFTKIKEKIPTNKRTDVIYEIPCLGTGEPDSTCKLSYVGQTKQFLEKRLKNHKNDLKKPTISFPKTAVVQHFHDLGHYPDFENARILGIQRHYSKRLTIEALNIYTHNTYNQRRDVENIAAVYCAIIKDTKKRKRDYNHTQQNTDTDTQSNKRRRLQ